MSTPHSRIPPLEVRERAACMCVHGGVCSAYAPGHALHLIQARLAAATTSDWLDAVVESVDTAAGEIVVRTVADAAPIVLWNAGRASALLTAGTPVAIHGRYSVLAIGALRFNILRLP